MKQAEIWVCDICRKTETSEFFPRDWFEVCIESGSKYYELGDNRNIKKDCCSEVCVKKAVEPLIKENK